VKSVGEKKEVGLDIAVVAEEIPEYQFRSFKGVLEYSYR